MQLKNISIVKVIFPSTRIICRRKHARLSSRVEFPLQIVLGSIVYRLMPGRNLYNLAGVYLVTKHDEITYMCN